MDAKQFLSRFRDRYSEIDSADELVQTIRSKMANTAASPMDSIHVKSGVTDKNAYMLSWLSEAQERLQRLLQMQEDERSLIQMAVDKLPTAQQRSIISLRYLADMRWSEVTRSLFGHLDDFEQRDDSYLRRVTKAHGAALKQLDSILEALAAQQDEKAS